MKVKELIKLLRHFDLDANVFMQIENETPYFLRKDCVLKFNAPMLRHDYWQQAGIKNEDVLIHGVYVGSWDFF